MAFLSLIAVLLIEQFRPLPYRWIVHEPLLRLARFLEERFNAGERSHGVIAWLIGVGGVVLVAGGIHAAISPFSDFLAWGWGVLVLYMTMGFRQFSHYFTDIQFALRMDDLPRARGLLAEWRGQSAEGLSSSEIACLAIKEALAASHRHVFGVLLCFIILPGPCGAVLYRAAAVLAESWGSRPDSDTEVFGRFAQQAFFVIDWLPSRLTAAGFAIVGNFEDAVYCWRAQAGKWVEPAMGEGGGIVVASGAGAIGVRLGLPADEAGDVSSRASSGFGDEADADSMQSGIGLVWRALLLWLLMLLLLGLAGLTGF